MKYPTNQRDTYGPAASLSGACTSFPTGALLPVDLLTEFIQGLFLLDSDLRDVVGLRFLGATYREIGE